MIKYPKQYKVLDAGKEFHRLMKDVLKNRLYDKMRRPNKIKDGSTDMDTEKGA